MGIYVIGIGGTGAKCIEAITYLAATGIYTEETIKVMFVDADESNGSLERSRNNLSFYEKVCELIPETMRSRNASEFPWLKTKIESLGLWSPFGKENTLNKNLDSFFQYDNIRTLNAPLANLFDVLYTKGEQRADLDVGFRGRPAIGAAIMSQVNLTNLTQEPWGTLMQQIKLDAGGGTGTKILLCGSIFGGTGASGIPTIGRIIANELKEEKLRDKVKIGCLLMLPYFNFTVPAGEDPIGIYARSEEFVLNTEAALRYYASQAQANQPEKVFDISYLLGNQNLSQVKEFSIGNQSQRNDPHFLEIYAGLAVRHFLLNNISSPGLQVGLIAKENIKRLTWKDISDQREVKPLLVNATRFAYAWLAMIAPELLRTQEVGFDKSIVTRPWLRNFYSSGQQNPPSFAESEQQNNIKTISQWCETYLTWLSQLHQNESCTVELFEIKAFKNLKSPLNPDELKNLVFEDVRDENEKKKDIAKKILEKILNDRRIGEPNKGTIGLAKSLYKNISI